MGGKPDATPDLTGTDAALRAVLGACLADYRRREAGMRAGGSADAVHRARVSLRRLRAALAVFRPFAAPPAVVGRGLQGLSAALGRVRDLDVLLERAPSGRLHDRLAAARAEALASLLTRLRARPHQRLLRDLSDWILLHPPPADKPARPFAAHQLDRWRRRVKRAGASLREGDDASRHRLRKRVKTLRHAADLFGSLFHAKRQKAGFLAALEPVQAALGRLNDLVVAEAVLAQLGLDQERHAAALIGRNKRSVFMGAAREAHAKLMDAPRFWR
jgi:CHAD domain-containing protein